uniref:Myosin tail domain-containing protein n=1 Tax=Anopheles atroparvus TaxID=41427 RepID=A0A182JAX7_ANOAO
SKREKDDVDGRGKPEHEEAEDGKKNVDGRETTKHEEAEDGKKDGDGRENTSGYADQDGQTKKSKKGMGKKLKMCIGALQPFELHESQSSRENLIAKMSTQSEEQRVEVNRLDAELKKVTKDLAKLEQDKQSIQDKDRKNVESLQIMKQDLETMTSLRDKLNLELIKQEESHRSETSRLTEKLESVEKEKNELTVQHREQLTEAEMKIWRLKEEIQELEYEAARLKSITGTIEANPSTSATVERGTIFIVFFHVLCAERSSQIYQTGPFTQKAVYVIRNIFDCI